MGGRVAEEMVFGQMTTGAGNDIERATDLARNDGVRVGHERQVRAAELRQARGRGLPRPRLRRRGKEYSEDTAVEIDAEMRTIVTAQYERAKKVVTEHREKLKLLAEALLEHETLDGVDIDTVFAGGRLERKPPTFGIGTEKAAAANAKQNEKPARPSIFAPPRPVPDKA